MQPRNICLISQSSELRHVARLCSLLTHRAQGKDAEFASPTSLRLCMTLTHVTSTQTLLDLVAKLALMHMHIMRMLTLIQYRRHESNAAAECVRSCVQS